MLRKFGLSLFALISCQAANAETLRVQGLRPAAVDELATIRTIGLESFGGQSGSLFAIEVEDRLRGVDLGQGPWFSIVPTLAYADVRSAVLRGRATMDVDFSDYSEERERCVRDSNRKCTAEREKYKVPCYSRRVELAVTSRLVAQDGALLWSDNRAEPFEDSHCADSDDDVRKLSSIEQMLAARIAQQLREQLAPRQVVEDVRVDESRKGLDKQDAEVFKAAVRAVKVGEAQAACASWTKLGAIYPDHHPTQFNIGLCAEAAGNDRLAQRQYGYIVARNARHTAALTGQRRIESRQRAQRQIEAHWRD